MEVQATGARLRYAAHPEPTLRHAIASIADLLPS